MGLGRFGGGVGVTRYLAGQGARVLVTDQLQAEALAESVAKIADLGAELRLGEHREEDFAAADLVVVNPAVDPRGNRYLQAARAAGVELTWEINLLLDRVDHARVAAVTGSAGKSTTTSMIAAGLRAALGADRVHLGGNIGGSLLGEVDRIGPQDWVVLELSSFMLENLPGIRPHVAVVTNLTQNHLDRHETMENYAAAKQNILRNQSPGDWAILGSNVADWAGLTKARVQVVLTPAELELQIPGAHNRLNAAMALAACDAVLQGTRKAQATQGVVGFTGLPHRLQRVGAFGGVAYFNDSKSTTPEAAELAIEAFEPGAAHIILGGYDKHSDLGPLAQMAARRCAGIYTIGATGDAVAGAAEGAAGCPVHRCGTLENAVRQAAGRAKTGQVVLLSPACASWDQFTNYEQRGETFGRLAREISETSKAATGAP